MSTTLTRITNKARAIRKPGEAWTTAVKRASKIVMGGASKKAAGPKKKRKVTIHQTGSSNKKIDKRLHAKSPGKRTVRHKGKKSTTYYEYRQNKSDMPGRLTGTSAYNETILRRMGSNNDNLRRAETELAGLKHDLKLTKDKVKKNLYRNAIKKHQKYIASIKSDNRMLKRLIA